MDSVRDLGIHVDSDLSFRSHVRHVVKSSKRLINLCFKMFTSCEQDTFISFYKLYVISVITYGSPIYSLVSVSNINEIEKIQKYFTKRLYLRLYPNTLIPKYADRLGLFHLVPLEFQLIKIDLVVLYRFANGILEVPGVNVLRSHHLPARLQITSLRTTLCRSFYLHRTIMIWNKFLSYKQFSSIAQFKSFIDTLSLDRVCKGSALKAL